ncbi:hypothetical protein [Modicisalibacter sp. MOD 31.J]|uniref:hypothetical protein n=1 Tax=Modicisalibacter sp. MOD 31.J TaxID=2831897 RepID=UPI001CCC620E|nr:hypothetical protein [Modicisalibacter sp. MOD 31.J]MBZ9574549.1 hypothetical protein [Modicisalibacter sp. MOD 31.J]
MMRFNKRVRESIAIELKRVAWSGSAVFGVLGWTASSGWVAAGMVMWWVLVQSAAHLVLAVEDTDTG